MKGYPNEELYITSLYSSILRIIILKNKKKYTIERKMNKKDEQKRARKQKFNHFQINNCILCYTFDTLLKFSSTLIFRVSNSDIPI